jgi:hypothetical protein
MEDKDKNIGLLQELHIDNQSARLRVGVFLFSQRQPKWVAQILSVLQESSYTELSLVIMCEFVSGKNQQPDLQTEQPFLWQFYAALDKALYKRSRKYSQENEINSLLQKCQILNIQPEISVSILHLREKDIQQIQEAHLDLILYFGSMPIEEDFIKSTRYGIWPYCDRFYQWRTLAKITRILLDLYEYGPSVLDSDPITSTFSPKKLRTFTSISNIDVIRLFSKSIRRKIENKIFNYFHRGRWEIIYQFTTNRSLENLDIHSIHRLKPPIHKIYADPFPIEVNGKYFLFFEEMEVDDSFNKLNGHISVLEIDPNKGIIGKIQKALEREYHLSYPFILKWEGNIYMIPETHQNKTIELYRCLSFPTEWELCKILMINITAVDITLFEKDRLWWLFASVPQAPSLENKYDGIKPQLNALQLYYADTPLGPWHPHPKNPVKLNFRSTRSAGSIFKWKDILIRPAQDCFPFYGYAVVLNRIDELTVDSYHETEISKLYPIRKRGNAGLHTFNFYNGLIVADFNRMRNRFLQ